MESLLSRLEESLTLFNNHTLQSPLMLYRTNCVVFVIFPVVQANAIPNIMIVSLNWLLDSVEERKLMDGAEYPLTGKTEDKSTTKSQTNGGKKRARTKTSDDDDAEEEASATTEKDEKPPVKRQRDGQKAKSGSALHVPVDEGCNLACKDA